MAGKAYLKITLLVKTPLHEIGKLHAPGDGLLSSGGKEKSYLVELNIFKENAFYGLQKILLDNFSRNFYI